MSVKADVTTLVSTLTPVAVDSSEVSRFFDEEMIVLGHDPRGWLTHYFALSLSDKETDGVVTLAAAGSMVRLLALFYDDTELVRETVRSLQGFDPEWRDRTGIPIAFTPEGESNRTVRFYPKPISPGTSSSVTTVDQGLGQIFTQARTTDIPNYLVMPLALRILAREFERESNHRDVDFATLARAIGEHFLDMVS